MSVNVDDIYGIHNTMLDKKILLAYKGEFDQSIVDALLTNAKLQMLSLKMEVPKRKKLYNIMVECLENINRYAFESSFDIEESRPQFPLFLLGQSRSGYYITVGNLIREETKKALKGRIDDVNNLSRKELKEKYRDVISNSVVAENGGAGLGIIDMAIKSENPLEYAFSDVKDDISFFVLEINI